MTLEISINMTKVTNPSLKLTNCFDHKLYNSLSLKMKIILEGCAIA